LNDLYWEAYAYTWLSMLQFNQAEPKAIETALRSIELARKAGERSILAKALTDYSFLLYLHGQTDKARKHLEEAKNLSIQIGSDTLTFVFVQIGLARIEWLDRNHQKAKALFTDSQARLHVLGDRMETSKCIANLGLLSIEEGDLDQAQAYLEEALSAARKIENEFLVARYQALLSILFYLQANIEKSKQYLRESIALLKNFTPAFKAYFLASLFISPLFQLPEYSVPLLGAIDNSQKIFDTPIEPLLKRYCARAETHARTALGTAGFESAFAEGQKMSLDEALELALKTVEEL
jgi:tetratricopeptide (TPR) repeat protein